MFWRKIKPIIRQNLYKMSVLANYRKNWCLLVVNHGTQVPTTSMTGITGRGFWFRLSRLLRTAVDAALDRLFDVLAYTIAELVISAMSVCPQWTMNQSSIPSWRAARWRSRCPLSRFGARRWHSAGRSPSFQSGRGHLALYRWFPFGGRSLRNKCIILESVEIILTAPQP